MNLIQFSNSVWSNSLDNKDRILSFSLSFSIFSLVAMHACMVAYGYVQDAKNVSTYTYKAFFL